MHIPKSKIGLLALFLPLAFGIPQALGQEVGKFAVVQNDVKSLKPGADEPVPAKVGAPILINEVETTGKASRAKFTFGEGAVVSVGQNTTFEVSPTAVDQATGKSTTKVDVAQGKARVFVSRFWGGRPEIEVNTPTAVVGIKGSEVLIEVAEDGGTTVTVFGGSAEVRSKSSQGGQRGRSTSVTAAQQVEATSSGVGTPVVVETQALATLWSSTEPTPTPPIELPSPTVVVAPSVQQGQATTTTTTLIATECLTCSGTTPIADPPAKATRDVPVVVGRPINSGTKAGRR